MLSRRPKSVQNHLNCVLGQADSNLRSVLSQCGSIEKEYDNHYSCFTGFKERQKQYENYGEDPDF